MIRVVILALVSAMALLQEAVMVEQNSDVSETTSVSTTKVTKTISTKNNKRASYVIINPHDCYLAISVFPLEYYADVERVLFRLRFTSNCLNTRDIVMVSKYSSMRPITEAKHPKSVNIHMFRKILTFKFGTPKVQKQSKSTFSKIQYTTASTETDFYKGRIKLLSRNSIVLRTSLTDIEVSKIKGFKSPIDCPLNPKSTIMSCLLFSN